MILEALAAVNFVLGAYDAYLTQRRMKAFGKGFELNHLIKSLSTRKGPEIAAVVGVLGPCVGWTYIFTYFHLTWALALLVGFNAKRFEIQLSSAVFEKQALAIQKAINEFGSTRSNPPYDESTSSVDPSNSKEGK